ncbi:MAG: SDR family NAD(P)-dependent oxidoreductase, partial [Pseudomonadales bacterium]
MNPCAIITGASRGIGKAAAKLFLEQGYRVLNLSRSASGLSGVEDVCIDMSKSDFIAQHGDAILKAVGNTTELVLVHNAATLLKDSIQEMDPQSFRDVLELNVVAPAALTRLLIPSMEAGSSVIYIASTLGTKAVSNSCSYVTSKHALIGLMKSTCQDLVGSGIHTLAICPGFTDTEMLRSHIGTDPVVEADIASTVAMGRLALPAEIAETIM